MKRILVLPGWMTSIDFFNPQNGLILQFGKITVPVTEEDTVIGIRLGALIGLRESAKIPGKIILVNPPLPKRSIFIWLGRLIKMILQETPFNNRQRFTKNPFRLAVEVIHCIKLLSTDFGATLASLPKERLTAIRGREDKFFADNIAVSYLHEKGVNLIEVDGGHNWSKSIESCVLGK